MIILFGILSYAGIIYMFINRKDENKTQYFFGFIILISIMSIEIVNQLTLKPHTNLTRGNVALFFYPLAIVSFIGTAISIFKMMSMYLEQTKENKRKSLLVIEIVVVFIISLLFYDNIVQILKSLGGSPTERQSTIYHLSWLNKYTNTMYINIYSYNIVIFASVIAAHIKIIWKTDEKEKVFIAT